MEADTREVSAAVGALLGTFAGDALGAGWEGAPPVDREGADRRLERAVSEPELAYTDDTQLMIALAEHLLDDPTVDPGGFAASILDHFEGWRGYGGGMYRLVDVWRDGVPVDEAATAVFSDGSFGNGAAMRVAPVGVRWAGDRGRLREVADRQAAITHAHPIGRDGAVAQATAVGLALTRGAFGRDELDEVRDGAETAEMRDRLALAARAAGGGADADPPAIAAELGNGVVAHRSVATALWIAVVAGGLPEAMVLALGIGGDADTIGAMAGAVLGAAGGREAIPRAWTDRFEDGPSGRSHVEHLGRRLAAAR